MVVVDQGTKLLASSQLADGRIVPLLPGLLNGQLVHTMALDHKAINGRPRKGAIGFQDHSLPLDIKNWRVRSL